MLPIGQRRSTWKIQPKNMCKWQWMQWWLKHFECTLYHKWLMLNATIHFRHRELVRKKQKKNTNYKKINTKSLTQTMAIHLACISSRRSKIIWRKKKNYKTIRTHRLYVNLNIVHLHKNILLKWNSWRSKSDTKTSYKSLNRRTEMVHSYTTTLVCA